MNLINNKVLYMSATIKLSVGNCNCNLIKVSRQTSFSAITHRKLGQYITNTLGTVAYMYIVFSME